MRVSNQWAVAKEVFLLSPLLVHLMLQCINCMYLYLYIHSRSQVWGDINTTIWDVPCATVSCAQQMVKDAQSCSFQIQKYGVEVTTLSVSDEWGSYDTALFVDVADDCSWDLDFWCWCFLKVWWRTLCSRDAFWGPRPGQKANSSSVASIILSRESNVDNRVMASVLLTDFTDVRASIIWKKQESYYFPYDRLSHFLLPWKSEEFYICNR